MVFKLMISFLAAALMPVFCWAVLDLTTAYSPMDLSDLSAELGLLPIVFFVALAHTVLLGVPAVLIGWSLDVIRWWSALVVAFIIGAVPTALFICPLWDHYEELTIGQEQFVIHGVTTLAGWISYVKAFSFMGLMGLSGGLVFWLLWRYWIRPQKLRKL
jgi:hypothetical protein